MGKIRLKSIAEEKKAALKANAKSKAGVWVWHVHHMIIAEPITNERRYSAKERIQYIATVKPHTERALRLRMMRPISPSWLKTQPAILAVMKQVADLDVKYKTQWSYSLKEKRNRAVVKAQKMLKAVYPLARSTWNGRTIFPKGWEKQVTQAK